MTYEQFFFFIKQYFDQPNVGNTAENKGQCVGLISVYQDALGITHEWGNAKDFLANADTSKFEIVLNAVEAVPVAGDILVYGKNYGGGVGHVALCVWASQMKLVRFEQNNPTGSNPILTTCPYDNNLNGLLGWLHPLNGLQSGTNTSQTILDQSDAFIALCTLLNVSANKDLALAEINKLIAIEDAAPQKDKQLSDAQSQITFLQQQMATLQVQHDALQKQIDDQSKTIDTQDAQIQTLDQNIKDLQTQLNKPVLAGWKLFIFKLISR